eukprot:Lithocolla_globosa_v1_NODE_2790_length_1867_cov_8.598234.p2 type:complete len:130 gc:universal NODE_2790_length_1867_cov_8.598234:411-800(+)
MMDPVLCLKFNARFINEDRYSKLTFALTQEVYDDLISELPFDGILPVTEFEWKGKKYLNLKVKKTAVPDSFNSSDLKNKSLDLFCSFYKCTFMKNEGVRCVVDNFEVIEDKVERKYREVVAPLSKIGAK